MRRSAWLLGFGLLALLALGALPSGAQVGTRLYLPVVHKDATPTPGPIAIAYRAYVQDLGWLPWTTHWGVAGTEGQARRLEAFEFVLTGGPPGATIAYRAHVSGSGWQDWKLNGQTAGGAGSTIEAIQVALQGQPATGTYLVVATNLQEWGWIHPVRGNWIAGTTGQARRMEAFRAYIRNDREQEALIGVAHSAYLETAGWQPWKKDPDYSGTTGQNLRLEAYKMVLYNHPDGMGIEYRSNVEGNWQDWTGNGNQSGTTGEAKKINSMQVRLVNRHPGTILSYGAHFENRGWLQFSEDDPANNNPELGNPNDRFRLEAIRIGPLRSNQ
jgi:uncharacterized protein YjdB